MNQKFTEKQVADQSGKTFLVTGANSGLGLETSKVLADRGARVLLGCRSEQKASSAMAQILKQSPHADLRFIPLDQASLKSVQRAAELVREEERLDVLVNNAGIMVPPLEYTQDGFESQLGVNHFGTYALTLALIDKLSQSDTARVVVTSSLAHKSGVMLFDDIDATESYNPTKRYSQSKLANLLFMYELNRRLVERNSPVVAVGCHPGVAITELSRHLPTVIQKGVLPVLSLAINSARQGAWPTLMAATLERVERDDYFGPSRFFESSGPAMKVATAYRARKADKARQLWEISAQRTGLDLAD